LNGINQSTVKVTLRNPLDHDDQLIYIIKPYDNELARDWIQALKGLLINRNLLEKNFCFLGFPKTQRTLEFLCDELNHSVEQINLFNLTGIWQAAGLKSYVIEEWFHPNTVRFSDIYPIILRGEPDKNIGLSPKQHTLNRLHNYFEQLQGTVWNLSDYYKSADYETKYAIRQLNNICHEMEGLILSQRKLRVMPEWVRPSQITTFLHAERYELKDQHRNGFISNSYDRKFGHVYMHWTQIGKTLFEVWRDEDAPSLDHTTCEAINSLKYYSGEFDVEWGNSVTYHHTYWWHVREQDDFRAWLVANNLDPTDKQLSLGYLPLGEVLLEESFGTTDTFAIWDQLSSHLDIYSIEVGEVKHTFDYCWTDADYKQKQIDMMRPGYDFSSRR
jgi:hypothetical protein